MDARFLVPGTIKQGYLIKSPPLDKGTAVFKGWKKRWVILYLSQRELFLQYYENEESARGNSPPKSTVSLKFCEKVDVDMEHSSYKNVFAIYLPERTYYFSAPSQYEPDRLMDELLQNLSPFSFEMKEWGDAICTHLQLNEGGNKSPLLGRDGRYGTLPPSLDQYGSRTMMSSVYGLAGAYGTLPSRPVLASPSLYNAVRGPPPPPPPSSSEVLISPPFDVYSTLHSAPSNIQQRSLPPTPTSRDTATTTPRVSRSLEPEEAPPVPPRFHSVQPNIYSITPTR